MGGSGKVAYFYEPSFTDCYYGQARRDTHAAGEAPSGYGVCVVRRFCVLAQALRSVPGTSLRSLSSPMAAAGACFASRTRPAWEWRLGCSLRILTLPVLPQGHPMKPHRVRMAHDLLLKYDILNQLEAREGPAHCCNSAASATRPCSHVLSSLALGASQPRTACARARVLICVPLVPPAHLHMGHASECPNKPLPSGVPP